jgi:hypothetical protein
MLSPIVSAVLTTVLTRVDKEAVRRVTVAIADVVSRGEGHANLRHTASMVSSALKVSSASKDHATQDDC